MHAEHNHQQLRITGPDALQQREAAALGHVQVDDQQIGLVPFQQRFELAWPLAFGTDLQIRLAVQQMLDAVSQDGVVIEERDLDHVPLCQRIRIGTLALNGRLHIRWRYGLRVHVLLRQPGEAKENRRDRRRTTSAPSATT
jgi:hypothetical protein